MSLEKHNRIERILEVLRDEKRAKVKDLARMLSTTEITLRRDLRELEEQNIITRVYGGAILNEANGLRFSFEKRLSQNIEAKRRIGKKAVELIQDGDVIYLDPGTTCGEMARYLSGIKRLTIIINSSRLAELFKHEQEHRIIYLAGEYQPQRMDVVGELAEDTLSKLGGYKMFSGADGIDLEQGLSAGDISSARLARAAIQNASKVVFLGDSSKFDNPALYRIDSLDVLDYIVTDKTVSPKWRKAASSHGIKILYAAKE